MQSSIQLIRESQFILTTAMNKLLIGGIISLLIITSLCSSVSGKEIIETPKPFTEFSDVIILLQQQMAELEEQIQNIQQQQQQQQRHVCPWLLHWVEFQKIICHFIVKVCTDMATMIQRVVMYLSVTLEIVLETNEEIISKVLQRCDLFLPPQTFRWLVGSLLLLTICCGCLGLYVLIVTIVNCASTLLISIFVPQSTDSLHGSNNDDDDNNNNNTEEFEMEMETDDEQDQDENTIE